MFKSIQTKVLFFLVLITVAFLLAAFYQYESQKLSINEIIFQSVKDERARFLKSLSISGKNLEVFAYDYSYWNEMINFLNQPDTAWASINVDDVLETFNSSAVWLLDTHFHQVYSVNNLNDRSLNNLILNQLDLEPELSRSPFNHFFVKSNSGLIEIRTAPIQFEDSTRLSVPVGYLIVGKLWDKNFLTLLSELNSGEVSISENVEELPDLDTNSSDEFTITASENLFNLSGVPFARVILKINNPLAKLTHDYFSKHILESILFSSVILIFLIVFFFFFINKPFNKVSLSLRTNDPALLKSLISKKDEFGNIAVLLIQHFQLQEKIINEINEKHIIEKSLRDSEELYRSVLLASEDAFIILDYKFNCIFVNKKFSDLFNVSIEDFDKNNFLLKLDRLTNKPLSDLIDIFDLPSKKLTFKCRLDSVNNVLLDLDIECIGISLKNKPLLLIRITDITERVKRERELIDHNLQLQQAERLASLGLMVSGIAHEINNPNSFISLNLSYIKDRFDEIMPVLDQYHSDNPDFKIGKMDFELFKTEFVTLLSDLKEGSDRITKIINELRQFARGDSKSVTETFQPVDIFRYSVRILNPYLDPKKAAVTEHLLDNFTIKFDKQKLMQVFINLIINSVDALPDRGGSIIYEELINSAGLKSIRIIDNGCGISEDNLRFVFDPFFSTKPSGGGTGLGLSISRNIIESANGNIQIESAIDKGTIIQINFEQ